MTIAFVRRGSDVDDDDLLLSPTHITKLLHDIFKAIQDESNSHANSLPSATKILQPKDKHLISRNNFTDSSLEFTARSEHFYYGKQLLDK